MKRYKHCIIFILIVCLLIFSSCQKEESQAEPQHDGPPRDNTPYVLVPEASGSDTFTADNTILDISNISEGYFMVQYTGSTEKVRVQIIAPDGVTKQPLLKLDGGYQAFPLCEGDGDYQINILENVTGTTYAVLLSQTVTVTLSDEFKPFLYPNQFVNYQADTAAVAKGSELAADTYDDLSVIQNIYNYVIENITYDKPKADEVEDGYLPNLDETLSSGEGICFDYASLMTCMMRTQHIPTKLEIGYSGETKHAWISAYVDEIGWVDNIIEFDGSSWTLMDPTLAANNSKQNVKKYIGDGDNYTLQYSY